MSSFYRRHRLETAMDRVTATMRLRRPQLESLRAVHDFISFLPRDLRNVAADELRSLAKESYPQFSFVGHPHFTFALATGVGKTRLMAAIIAYLYLAGQSSSFAILAPRRAILRRLISEARAADPNYLFVDSSLIPEPILWHTGNLESFRPTAHALVPTEAPELFVMSPQSFVGADRRADRPSEFVGVSVKDYLQERDDLVALVDEAHHLGRVLDADSRAWTEAVRSLTPKLQYNMTATPGEDTAANVVHSYPLAQALRERLYTKDVQILVRQQPPAMTDSEEWDHITLRFALDRLARKHRSLAERGPELGLPLFTPVLLVAAEDTAHADEVARWLHDEVGLANDEVLVVHSRRNKTEEDYERLVGIQRPSSRVRVVVNVFELTEGWDVTNVYVIAALRAMGTYKGALQTMGRGLRLPAGRRVEDDDLDTLDVVCFGRESLQQILDAAISDYGDADDVEAPVRVTDADDEAQEDRPLETQPLRATRPVEVPVPDVAVRAQPPDLSFDLRVRREIGSQLAATFRLGDATISSAAQGLRYERPAFVRLAASRVVAGLRYLNAVSDGPGVQRLIEAVLDGIVGDEQVLAFDWVEIAEVVKDEIDRRYRKQDPIVTTLPTSRTVSIDDGEIRVPVGAVVRDPSSTWTDEARRSPFGPWARSVYEIAIFDSEPELCIARLLDRTNDVEWWLRNDPVRLRVPSTLGEYRPDFLVRTAASSRLGQGYLLVEAKGDHLWSSPLSDARVRATGADRWAQAVSAAGATTWRHCVVLGSDARDLTTIDDLWSARVNDG
jgi:hypothetical protein